MRTYCLGVPVKALVPGETVTFKYDSALRLVRLIEARTEKPQPYSITKVLPGELTFQNIGEEPWEPQIMFLAREGTGTPFDWPQVLRIHPQETYRLQWNGSPFKLQEINVHIPYRLPQSSLMLTAVKTDNEDQLVQEITAEFFQASDVRSSPQLSFPGAQSLRLDFRNVGDVPLEALVWLGGRTPR